MQAKIRFVVIFLVCCLPYGLAAHQPDVSSTLLIEQEKGNWSLRVSAALAAFEYAIEARYGSSAYTTPEEFRKLVLRHLKEQIAIHFNAEEKAVSLQNGRVHLGHETSVTFDFKSGQGDFAAVEVMNAAFQMISRNQSVLIIIKPDVKNAQFVLDESNHHTVQLQLNNGSLVPIEPIDSLNAYLIGGGVALLLVLVYTLLKARSVS